MAVRSVNKSRGPIHKTTEGKLKLQKNITNVNDYGRLQIQFCISLRKLFYK